MSARPSGRTIRPRRPPPHPVLDLDTLMDTATLDLLAIFLADWLREVRTVAERMTGRRE